MFAPRLFASSYFAPRYFPHGANVATPETGVFSGVNRFRSAIVPEFKDMDEVRRFLQRTIDEIARSMNPIRSVADGGTGISALERGELLAGSDAANTFARIKGNSTNVRMVLVSQGNGVDPGIPFWDVLQEADVPGTSNGVLVGTDIVLAGTSTVISGSDSAVNFVVTP